MKLINLPNGDLELRDTIISKWNIWVPGLVCLFVIFLTFYIGYNPINLFKQNIILGVIGIVFSIVFIFCGTMSIPMTLRTRRIKIFSSENKVVSYVKFLKESNTKEVVYKYFDIYVMYSSGHAYYNLLFFTGNGDEHFAVKDLTNPNTVAKVKEFAINVLKNTVGYQKPEMTLEERTSKKQAKDVSGAIAQTLRDVFRAIS